jgi:hypothetical protein
MLHFLFWYMHWHKGALGVVDGETSRPGEAAEQTLDSLHRAAVRTRHNQRVVGVLQDCTWVVRREGVMNDGIADQQSLENISYQDE